VFFKQNIFLALDSVVRVAGQPSDSSNKTIVSSIENIIYNIAQCDYSSWNMGSGAGGNTPLH
jgi:hypothetical protein